MTLTFPIRSDKLSMNVHVREHLHHELSDFQAIDIYDTDVFGRALFLDGHIQLTTFDEAAYHECLVDIPALSLSQFRRALVIGGGDGGALRELCRHRSLEHVDVVEIDPRVVAVSKQLLPTLSAGAFEDPRASLHIEDAFAFVQRPESPYDLIVVDSTDVYEDEEGELSERLFTDEFYAKLSDLLAPSGMVVTQADNVVFCPESSVEIDRMFARIFPEHGSYRGLVPSFGGYSGFCWASKGATLREGFEPGPLHFSYLNEATYALAFSPLSFSAHE